MTTLPTPKQIAASLCHGVSVLRFEYASPALGGTTTRFHALVPDSSEPLPVIYYLSGLTCTDENCVQKGAPYASLAENKVAMILPDTSPRGAGAPGEDESWDFGTGAGFYVDATTPGFEAYQMRAFVVDELPVAVAAALGDRVDTTCASITGHSMGGHGALMLAHRHPDKYRSVSAFAPIVNPFAVPWGKRCFKGYLGEDEAEWKRWDASEIVREGGKAAFDDVLVDQGKGDQFLERELRPAVFAEACKAAGQKVSASAIRARTESDRVLFAC